MLTLEVVIKEKTTCGAAAASLTTRLRRGPAWVPKGKAKTATWWVGVWVLRFPTMVDISWWLRWSCFFWCCRDYSIYMRDREVEAGWLLYGKVESKVMTEMVGIDNYGCLEAGRLLYG